MPPASTFGKVSRSHLRNIHLRNATLFIDGAATGGGARARARGVALGASESRAVGIGGCTVEETSPAAGEGDT